MPAAGCGAWLSAMLLCGNDSRKYQEAQASGENNFMRKKNYTFWLVLIYIIMAAVCAALILFTKMDTVSIVINIAMFFFVGIIFIFSIQKFSIGWRMQKALYAATKKIRELIFSSFCVLRGICS